MKQLFTLLFCLVISAGAYAHGDLQHSFDPLEKRFITNNKSRPDAAFQQKLRLSAEWQSFKSQHGAWWVQFNETNSKPHRAFGEPIALNFNGSPAAAALYFINNHLGAYIPANTELELSAEPAASRKYLHANFIQKYNGLEVLWSRITVQMTPSYEVVMFGADVYSDINMPVTPAIGSNAAIASAVAGIPYNIVSAVAQNDLKILPVPNGKSNTYKLVYEVMVETDGEGSIPGKYYTLIDANDGSVVYRKNKVVHFASNDVTVKGTVYPSHPYNPSAIVNLPNLKVDVGGTTYYTDSNGFLSIPGSANPASAIFSLEGFYAKTLTGANGTVVPSFNLNLNQGANTADFDGTTSIRHISAYYHTNVVHDFMRGYFTSFTDMDFPLDVRVDRTDGNCNAFYNGQSINFYTTSNGCNALSQVADVIYHEYGHGISDFFWSSNGLNFSNGAMGEGYSDVWGMCITGSPILGIGYSSTDPNMAIRRYDFPAGDKRKVYPQDIQGEVHADGEIIAGAWWSTGLAMGSLSDMTALFAESQFGLANGPDGAEGQVYVDILVDALLADDNDANLVNGTPNVAAIAPAFAAHGITLLSNSDITHNQVITSPANTQITLDATLANLQFAWMLQGVSGAYKINNSSTWNPITFTNTTGLNYTANIPGQPNGTIISYYLGIEDINGVLSNVLPTSADAANPNIPYFTMVGFNLLWTDDFDNTAGIWVSGDPTDNAVTGMWEEFIPEQTVVNFSTVVQPDFQHTPGGQICYVTGGMAGSGAGDHDVDGGKTTLYSPVLDLSAYQNPAIEYWRWYSNDQGATPGTDFWQVALSNDGGSTWTNIENTNVADHSWRNFVFRVKDYLPLTNSMKIRFIAEDANDGSLIEALMDDFSVYEALEGVSVEELSDITAVSLSPNPASDQVKLNLVLAKSSDYTLTVTDVTGRTIYTSEISLVQGNQNINIDVSTYSNGMYHLTLNNGKGLKMLKFNVIH